MRSVKGRTGRSTLWRRLVMASLGIPLGGCAAMTRDVEAYYRQMAVNYEEAVAQAKSEETRLEKLAKVYSVTGDQKQYRNTRRELDRVRDWEEHCGWEQERFEKAARWMESHFDINTKADPKASGTADAARPGDGEDVGGGGMKATPGD
jgi:hypothetical protein